MLFDLSEIQCVCRGRWVLRDGMHVTQYKGKVTRFLHLESLSFAKSISSTIYNVSWQMTNDS